MYRESPGKLFGTYAVPQMIGLLLNSVYLIVDGVFIGNRLGRDAMAAAAVAVPVVEILIALSLLVSSGAGTLISGALARRQGEEANRVFNLAVAVMGGMSAAIALLGNLFLHPLATALGATPEIRGQAVEYLWYIVTFSPFLSFSFLLSGLVRSDNRPRLAMAALTAGSLSNILLDYVFMYPLQMGIAGAALATALGPVLSVALLLPHFLRKRGALHFAAPGAGASQVGRILALGFPQFIMEFTIGIVTFLYNAAIVRWGYGELGLAAYLVIGYLSLLLLTLFLGAAQGLQPLLSYFKGSGEAQKMKALLGFSLKMMLGMGAASYGLAVLLARPFALVFAKGDPQLVAFVAQKIPLYFCGFVAAGVNILLIAYWQAVMETARALLVSLLRSVLLLPLLLLLLPLAGGAGAIWACHSLTEVLTAAAAGVLATRRGQAGAPVGPGLGSPKSF